MTGEIICRECKKGMSLDRWVFIHFILHPRHHGQQVNTHISRMLPWGGKKKCSNCGRMDWRVHQKGNGCNICKPYKERFK